MTWSVKYPLSIIVGGDTKQSGFTKVKDEFTSIYGDLDTHVHDGTADNGPKITAANVVNVAAGGIAATTVQAAINELDTEKLALTGGTLTGLLIEKKGADIASSATINLSTATGNLVHITGTTQITAVTMASGQRMTVIFDGALTLTHHATNNNLPSGANITTAAGDRATYWSDGTTVYCTDYTRASGTPIVAATGSVVQVVNYQTGTLVTGTTQIPTDDTIPQNTEGDEYMTLAITPTSATNKLKIDVVWIGASDMAGSYSITAALFKDSTANALAAATATENANFIRTIHFTHWMTAGATSSTTFKVRAGGNTVGTTTFNGGSGARIFGGVAASSITITEVKA